MEMTAYETGAACWADVKTTDRRKAIWFDTGEFSLITMAAM